MWPRPTRSTAATWLLTITRNLAIDAVRAHGADPVDPGDLHDRLPRSAEADPADAATHRADVDEVVAAYYDVQPDPGNPDQRVIFGTSGHRGASLDGAFNEAHIAATTKAISTAGSSGIPGSRRQSEARLPCA